MEGEFLFVQPNVVKPHVTPMNFVQQLLITDLTVKQRFARAFAEMGRTTQRTRAGYMMWVSSTARLTIFGRSYPRMR
jgi:hypothetical protein